MNREVCARSNGSGDLDGKLAAFAGGWSWWLEACVFCHHSLESYADAFYDGEQDCASRAVSFQSRNLESII
jgi:hypothetical protein